MLELRKKGNKHWLLIDEEIGEFTPSKFTINRLNNVINVVYFNNLKSKEYNVSDCYIFDIDDTSGFNTSNGVAFMDKLEELNCPCFQKDVNNFYISGGSWSELTNFDALNDATLPLSGAEQIPIVQGGETKKVAVSEFGGGSVDLSTKLDKVSTSGVERAYIVNADGSQGTKATSEFKDVLEFANLASFPATGESGKIYIAIDTNLTYRWGGSSYVLMSSSLALGETSSTAYRGDRGKIAYDHSQVTGNPHGTTKNDIGLGNVDNTSDINKPISTATQNALNSKLDKSSTPSSVYATDAEGLQVMKPISEFQPVGDYVTVNTTQTITGNKTFNNVGLIKKNNTATYPTTSGGVFYIGGNDGYDAFEFYSIDGSDKDSFGSSQIYSNPEEGNYITHNSLDNQRSSTLNINYGNTYLRNIFGGQQTSLYVNGITDKITIEGTQNKLAALGTSLITGTKNFEFPDKNGTLALSSDIIESAENKLDKVSTSGVERAYIVNADGSQGTKATSEFGTVKGTGTINRISKFTASDTIGDSQIFDNGTNVGIGTTSPQARLDVRAQGVLNTDIVLRVRNSTDTQNFLVVNGAGDVYNNGAKGVNTNTFFGENIGRNATGGYNTAIGLGALSANTTGNSNAAIGVNALYANTTGGANTAIGASALYSNTTGYSNAAIGVSALQNNTSGNYNTAIGQNALYSNTTGGYNAATGQNALRYNTTGGANTAIGVSALGNNTTGFDNAAIGTYALLANTTGNSNMAIGVGALRYNTIGGYNAAIGVNAGSLISNGSNNTITNNSIFIGGGTRALADNQTNQIVIGYNAIGLGSNSVVLGNTSITITQLRGQVIMGAFNSAPTGIEGAIYYDSTTKKHRGFDGTAWNDLY